MIDWNQGIQRKSFDQKNAGRCRPCSEEIWNVHLKSFATSMVKWNLRIQRKSFDQKNAGR